MQKLNFDFYPNNKFLSSDLKKSDIEDVEIEFVENGLFVKNNPKTFNFSQKEKNVSEIEKSSFRHNSCTLYEDLLKFFDNKYKYYELSKISNGVNRFKSNLFRHACSNLFPESEDGICKKIYNYVGYDQIRGPVDYVLYRTGPNEDFIEGMQDGVYYLQYGNSPEQRVVLVQQVTWGGSLYLEAYGIDRKIIKQTYKDIFSWMNENNFFKGKKIDLKADFLKLDNENWDDIVLSSKMEKMLDKHLIKYIEKFDELKKKKLPTSRGFLLHGYPGTGKSFLGKIIANQINTSFIWVPYTNNNSWKYSEIYELAREISPTIVFLEDLASHGGLDRRNGNSSPDLGMLLNILSGIESNSGVITFATENYVENLDEALRNRPGRFDYVMEMALPQYEQRFRLLKKFLPDYSINRITTLAEKSNNFSCAHLRELVNRLLIEDDAPENDLVVLQDMIEMFCIKQEKVDDEPTKN